jgi:hypothetical protein
MKPNKKPTKKGATWCCQKCGTRIVTSVNTRDCLRVAFCAICQKPTNQTKER